METTISNQFFSNTAITTDIPTTASISRTKISAIPKLLSTVS